MIKKVHSKKGFALPIAMSISLILIVLATSLMFIAMSSRSTTSSDINGRQAYLNVRSALEYAQNYYSKLSVSAYTTMQAEPQYMWMVDEGGTTSQGAKITKIAADAEKKATYVKAEYIPAASSGAKAKLKLTAFATYTDSFGNKAKSMRLSISFDVGGASPRRYTIMQRQSVTSGSTADNINLHIKKPDNLNWTLCYYAWTYKDKDRGNAYDSYNEKSGHNSYTFKSLNIDRHNTTESEGNKVEVAGVWESSGHKAGPPAVAGSDGTGWSTGTISALNARTGETGGNRENVPYFNIIFAKKGAVFNIGVNGIWRDNSQFNEIFHLWYLDPSEKDIYFEFKDKSQINTGMKHLWHQDSGNLYDDGVDHGANEKLYSRYEFGKEWDGITGLKDTVLVYVYNTKTVLHCLIKQDSKAAYANNSTPSDVPKIISAKEVSTGNSVGRMTGVSSGTFGNMEYEGYSWWVDHIGTNKNFQVTISYKGKNYTCYNVSATTIDRESQKRTREAWVYLDPADVGTLSNSSTEQGIRGYAGIGDNEYVTVHAKTPNYESASSPKLSYKKEPLTTTEKRDELGVLLRDAMQRVPNDYTETSYQVLYNAIVAANKDYEDQTFISNQPGSTDIEKMNNADAKYQTHINNLNMAINGLQENQVNGELKADLVELIENGDKIVQDQADNGYYEGTAYHDLFEATDFDEATGETTGKGAYQTAKAEINSTSLTNARARKLKTALEKVLNGDDALVKAISIKDIKDQLKTHNANAETLVSDSRYEESYRIILNKLYNGGDIASGEIKYTDASHTEHSIPAQTAYSGTKGLTDKTCTSKAAIEFGLEWIVPAIKAVTDHEITVYDTAELDSAIAEANTLAEETENFTDQTRVDLNNAITEAYASKSEPTSQANIDNKTDKLKNAIKKFHINKPINTDSYNASLSPKTVRVWVVNDSTCPGFDMDLVVGDGSTQPLSLDYASFHNMDSVEEHYYKNFYYYDVGNVSETGFTGITLKLRKPGTVEIEYAQTVPTQDLKERQTALVYHITDKADGTGYEVGIRNMTTVYIPKKDENGDSFVSAQFKYKGEFVKTVSEGEYYVGRILSPSTANIGAIQAKRVGDVTVLFGPAAETVSVPSGQYVARCLVSELSSVNMVNANDIYPKYTATSGGGSGYSVTTLDMLEGTEVTPISTDTSSYTIENTGVTKKFDITPGAGEVCLVFKMGGSFDSYKVSDTVYIYVWNTNSGDSGSSSYWPGTPASIWKVNGVDTGWRYLKVSKNAKHFIVNIGSNAKQTADLNLPSDFAYHKYCLIDSSFGTRMTDSESDLPTYTVPDDPVTTFDSSNLPMAYVGGKKVRIENECYVSWYNRTTNSYGQNGKKNDNGNLLNNSNYKFGGETGVLHSSSRVGAAKLLPYYDWYERKIPVSAGARYHAEVSNLVGDSKKTKQVHNAMGDIWIDQLEKSSYSGGYYSNVNVYTFDPEIKRLIPMFDTSGNQTNKVRVYVRIPAQDTAHMDRSPLWTNVKLTATGLGETSTTALTSHLTRRTDVYYCDIDRNSPFITITATATLGSGSTATSFPRTFPLTLQGEDQILFDLGTESWDTYISEQESLRREVSMLLDMYYGKKLITNYKSDGTSNDNSYRYPDKILDLIASNYLQLNNGVYTLKLGSICNMGEVEAYNKWHGAYAEDGLYYWRYYFEMLYQQMSSAKAFIKTPVTGPSSGRYEQYLNRTNYRSYSNIDTLRNRLLQAENTFTSGSASLNDIKQKINNLARAQDGLIETSEGSIAILMLDAQDRAKSGHKIEIEYDYYSSSSVTTPVHKREFITDKSIEGHPIYFVQGDISSGYHLRNVTLYDNNYYNKETRTYEGRKKIGDSQDMSSDEQWVYLDYEVGGKWVQNSEGIDYRQIAANTLDESDGSSASSLDFTMKNNPAGGKYEMVLYFDNDVQVKCSAGNYVIKAGAYDFTDENAKPFTAGTMNIFSADAKDYFDTENSDPDKKKLAMEHAGFITSDDVVDARSLSTPWYDGNTFRGTTNSITKDVNLEAGKRLSEETFEQGSFTRSTYYTYSTNKNFNFRWSSKDPLKVSKNVNLYAGGKFTIASVGKIDGTAGTYASSHFRLNPYSRSTKTMEVEFKTDVTVRYKDRMNKVVEFVIREGEYTLSRKTVRQADGTYKEENTKYIAELFDKEYWNSTSVKRKGGSSTSGDDGSLTGGDYDY